MNKWMLPGQPVMAGVHVCNAQCASRQFGVAPQTCRIPIGQSRFDQAIACVCDWCFFHGGPGARRRVVLAGQRQDATKQQKHCRSSRPAQGKPARRPGAEDALAVVPGNQQLELRQHAAPAKWSKMQRQVHCLLTAASHSQVVGVECNGSWHLQHHSAHCGIALGVLVGGVLPGLGQQAVVPAGSK